MMFNWSKKKKCNGTHYKTFRGESLPNMKTVICFDDSKNAKFLEYAVAQCDECGKRGLTYMFYGILPRCDTDAIDAFIKYKISLTQFEEYLTARHFKYEITKEETHNDV